MKGHEIFRSRTPTPSTLLSSGLHPVTTTSALNSTAGDLFTMVIMPSTTRVSLDRGTSSRSFSSHSRRPLWAKVRDALSVEGVAATRDAPVQQRPEAAGDGPAPHQPAMTASEAPLEPQSAAPTADRPSGEPPAAPAPRQNSEPSRVELTIDSLRNYELVKPIPVLVESLGERHYVAEVPDLNITTSASNLSEILIVLKDSVTQTYDKLRIRRNLDSEQVRQLKILESYIGKSKRSWLDIR